MFREEVMSGFTFDGGNPHKCWIEDVEEGKTSPGKGKNVVYSVCAEGSKGVGGACSRARDFQCGW